MNWINDERFQEQMQNEVEPYLAARRQVGLDERVQGEPVYFEHYQADAPKGVIVISHGFTESVAKFAESIYYMLQAGYEVWGLDHRGHGRSFRSNDNPYVVDVDRFEDYVEDLRHLTEKRIKPVSGDLPLYLFCHSMGGCIGAWTIEQYPELFQKAVLSSPMLGLSFGKIPVPLAYLVATLKGMGEKGKEPLSPVTEFARESYEQSASNSEPRFRWYYEQKLASVKLQTCAASTRWGREAIRATRHVTSSKQIARIRIPVLLFQAEKDVYVRNDAQDAFAEKAATCELVKLPGLRHELYMNGGEGLREYWEKIFAFYEK
ncbi:MAG: alpha/beta hydrolase [Oscillospiraceae bacterium]|nr:alpha/beta hydrolase [Oscillospiraceae bacterium]